jgi:hypothetical protein
MPCTTAMVQTQHGADRAAVHTGLALGNMLSYTNLDDLDRNNTYPPYFPYRKGFATTKSTAIPFHYKLGEPLTDPAVRASD